MKVAAYHLRASGFEIECLIEVRPPEGSTTLYRFVTLDWARKWPWYVGPAAFQKPAL